MSRKAGFEPVVDANTRLLILGSLPGDASLRAGQYYGHPRNAFWRLIGGVIRCDLAALSYEERLAALRTAGVGLWDVIASAERPGSLDAAIRAPEAADLRERIRTLPPGPGGTSTLTPAEVRVLRLLPTYLTAAEMAERLFVTPNTVRTQIQALYGKLGATSRAEAVEAAIENGLLEPLPVLAPGRITSI